MLAFGAPEYRDDQAALDDLRERFPRSKLLGCSTSGEIFQDELRDRSLSVAVARFEKSDVRTATVAVSGPEDSHRAGAQLASAVLGPDLRAVFVLSDGLAVNGSELVAGIASELPPGVTVTGGLAGDGDRFESTWILDAGCPASGLVTAVGLYGTNLHVGHGSKGGWDIFGPERRVTRSEGNVLYELDGKPALELYKRYLGDRAEGLPATALLFPLALREPQTKEETLVRTILGVDEDSQSMTFAGNVPEGNLAQLMRANFDQLIEGASDAALRTRRQPDATGATLSIAISCVGRRLILGERTEEEIEAALEELPIGTRQVGFYSYGELSPHASGACDLHNQTMTLTTLGEI